MDHILALDQGTTSSRAIVFQTDGKAISKSQREFRQIYPQTGWVEHDPFEILESQLVTAQEALGDARKKVKAIGITNQRETTLLWDRKTGKPIHNAIVWQDRRTAAHCDRLREAGFTQFFHERTGLVLDPYFSGTKLAWLLESIPGARTKADAGELCFGTVDTWLIYNFTNGKVHATDVTNASRTMLFNIHRLEWDDDLLACLNIPQAVLPNVLPSSAFYGNAAALNNLPIMGVAGDQHAALFGQACLKPGMAKNTYGTGCFMLLNTGTQIVSSQSGLLTTPAWTFKNTHNPLTLTPTYALEGSVFMAGAIVQWLRDEMQFFKSASEVEALAESVPDNGGVYLIPAFAGLGAPYWDPYARGSIQGLTRGTGRPHIARAALEAVAYQVRDVMEVMQQDSQINLSELRVDGGASSNSLLMQFQADILGVSVTRPTMTETSALGAAFLAGLEAKLMTLETIRTSWTLERRFEPTMDATERERLYAGWKRALERSKKWIEV